jgi:cation diffusion facilitator family transporter
MSNHEKTVKSTAILSIISNTGLAIIKGTTGVIGHSDALIADAIESTADVFASVLVLFGLNYSTKPADDNHPYGHGKAEALTTFAVVGFLLRTNQIIIEAIAAVGTKTATNGRMFFLFSIKLPDE